MGGRERVRDLRRQLEGFPDRQRAAGQLLGERLPFEVLHDDERTASLVCPRVEDRTDIRMLDGRDALGFLQQTPRKGGIVGFLIRNELDGDLTLEQEIMRQIHVSHPA